MSNQSVSIPRVLFFLREAANSVDNNTVFVCKKQVLGLKDSSLLAVLRTLRKEWGLYLYPWGDWIIRGYPEAEGSTIGEDMLYYYHHGGRRTPKVDKWEGA